MTSEAGSFFWVPERLTRRKIGRDFAAKAGDLLPLCDLGAVLLAGYFSLYASAPFVASTIAHSTSWSDLHHLIWVAAAIAPFLLYESRFAILAGDLTALLQGYARRALTFLSLFGVIVYAGRWLDEIPTALLALWLSTVTLFTLTSRLLLAVYLRRLTQQGKLVERVAVLGSGSMTDQLIPSLKTNAIFFSIFDDRLRNPDACVYLPESTVEELTTRFDSGELDRIVITPRLAAEPQFLSILGRLRTLGVPIELYPLSLTHPEPTIGYVGDWLPVALLADRPIKRWNAVLKSTKDFVLSCAITLVLLPILGCIALAIKLDNPGPILFKQRRHGYNNGEFDIYKFRTMRCASESLDNALKQTVRGDPRVTRVGRFLRKWSLDELPQVFNVLEGSMSLVGPRPHAVNMRTEARLGHEIVDVYPHRHRVKPGITGWSQINGSRGATDTVEQLSQRIKLDLYYVENWSMLLDIKILSRTFKEVLRATNAY